MKAKLVIENIRFQRGKDPKTSMGIGKATNPFVIEYAEREVDDDGYITGPLPEDHSQDTWYESADAWMTEEVLQNWKEEVDGSWYFGGHYKEDGSSAGDELVHAPEINDEWVEYLGDLYYIPDHSEYWSKMYSYYF